MKCRKIFSVNIKMYLLVLLFGLVFTIIGNVSCKASCLHDLGIGILSSSIVTMFVDYANTKLSYEIWNQKFKYYETSFLDNIKDMKIYIIADLSGTKNANMEEKKTFFAWINEAKKCNIAPVEITNCVDDLFINIREFRSVVDVQYNNPNVNNEFIEKLDRIKIIFAKLKKFKKGDYIYFFDELTTGIEIIGNLFSECKEEIDKKYNNDDLMED